MSAMVVPVMAHVSAVFGTVKHLILESTAPMQAEAVTASRPGRPSGAGAERAGAAPSSLPSIYNATQMYSLPP